MEYEKEPKKKEDFLQCYLTVEEFEKHIEVEKKLKENFKSDRLHSTDYAFAALLGIFAAAGDQILDKAIEFDKAGNLDKEKVRKALFGDFNPSKTFAGKLEKGKLNQMEILLNLIKNLGLNLNLPFLPGKVTGDILSDKGAESAADSLPQEAGELLSDILVDSFAIKGLKKALKKWAKFISIRGHKIKAASREFKILSMITFSVYTGVQILFGQYNSILGAGMSAYYFGLLVHDDFKVNRWLKESNDYIIMASSRLLEDIEHYNQTSEKSILQIMSYHSENMNRESYGELSESVDEKIKRWEG